MKLFTCIKNTILVTATLSVSARAFTATPSNAATRIHRTLPTSALQMDNGVTEAISGAWTSYNEALEANPLLVKSVTAGVILGAADLTGQTLERIQKDDSDKAIDIARVARFAIFGLVLQAPWNHFYYQLLDGALPPTPEPFTPTTGIKTVIDQFIQAPIFTVLIFAFLGFLEGKNAEEIKKQLENDYPDTMIANCKFIVSIESCCCKINPTVSLLL